MTISEVWDRPSLEGVETFDQLILGLDLLFLMGLIGYTDGRLVRA